MAEMDSVLARLPNAKAVRAFPLRYEPETPGFVEALTRLLARGIDLGAVAVFFLPHTLRKIAEATPKMTRLAVSQCSDPELIATLCAKSALKRLRVWWGFGELIPLHSAAQKLFQLRVLSLVFYDVEQEDLKALLQHNQQLHTLIVCQTSFPECSWCIFDWLATNVALLRGLKRLHVVSATMRTLHMISEQQFMEIVGRPDLDLRIKTR